MPDLRQHIQSTLGSAYRIERDLGGGMSRVFIAEDVQLGRTVVLKVLPSELAAGVNVERFEREIRLAARLQHPHIVPLLSAGAAGDLPYYLMPYIEGESLRARLAREGELPIPEVVRLLREVLDALDYAHQHGVVHRDIKPDNVLLSGRHAVVTDFGVAKALTEATGSARLTSTGLALGTPAYMAPEQIAGDSTVDHRADIYAVGALAFEMITGLAPFRGATTQAVLAAHMTQAPPPPSTLRQAIPPALDAIVMRCLEKRPADRWQTAGEVIAQLDAIAGPPTPVPGAAPSMTGAPNAARSPHPGRVALLFGLAAVGVLGIVWLLVQRLGLPDWVFRGAVVLIAVGLPIMFLTSHRERQRAAGARATPVGVQRLFTWRRSIQGGVLAFAALGLATTGFMTSRALGIGPGATLTSAGVLTARDRIVLADFTNRTTDSTLGLTITQLLRIDLSQSPSISVMEPAHVAEALARMQRDRATTVTADVAREVAEREGAKAFLTGEVLPTGRGFAITARLLSTSTGEALISLRQAASSADEVTEAVDRLSAKLREEIGESLRSVRADRPLEQVTTQSLDALRLYAEANRVADQGAYDRAIALMERAVELDSNFAMAWRRLGVWSSNPGMGPLLTASGDSAVRRAFALRAHLPERERLFVEAAIATTDLDLERAATAYLSVIEKYPSDETALNNAGAVIARMGRQRDALAMYLRSIATGKAPSLTYDNAVLSAAMLGELSLGDSILRLFQTALPQSGDLLRAATELAVARQDFRAVDSIGSAMLKGSPNIRTLGHLLLAMTAELEGRMADASREARNALRVDQERGALSAAETTMLSEFADIARVADYTSGQRTQLRRLNALWEQNRTLTSRRQPFFRRYPDFAPVFARLGDTARARQLMDEFNRLTTNSAYPAAGARVYVAARFASALTDAGRPDEGLDRLREECRQLPDNYLLCDRMAFLEVAQAHDRAGRTDSAIAAYRRFVELRARRLVAPARTHDDVTPKIAPAWRRLGELLESKGDRKGAIEAYERFLGFWRNADRELQPTVRTVRERANRLRRITG